MNSQFPLPVVQKLFGNSPILYKHFCTPINNGSNVTTRARSRDCTRLVTWHCSITVSVTDQEYSHGNPDLDDSSVTHTDYCYKKFRVYVGQNMIQTGTRLKTTHALAPLVCVDTTQ